MKDVDLNMLFQPNAHSVFVIQTVPAPAEFLTPIRNVAEHLPEGIRQSVREIRQVVEGMKSENFIVEEIWPDEKEPVRVIYRRNKPEADRHEIGSACEVLEYLYTNMVPVPRPLAFLHGYFSVQTDGRLWQRSVYIEGNHYQGSMEEMLDTFARLARLHHKLEDFPRAGNYPTKPFGNLDWGWWNECQMRMIGSQSGQAVSDNIEYLGPLVHEVVEDLEKLEGSLLMKQQLLHTDLHPQNLLCSGGELKAFIDFGNMCTGNLGMDLANTLHRLVRQHVIYQRKLAGTQAGTASGLIQRALPLVLGTYVKEYGGIVEGDLRGLPVFMREILLRKMSDDMHLFSTGKESDEEALGEINKFLGMLHEVDVIAEALDRVL